MHCEGSCETEDLYRCGNRERTGEAINAAISTLYEDMCATHSVADMAQGIRRGAQSSTAMDDIGNEEEMVNLRDKWLRRINNQQSLEHSESSDVKTGTTAPLCRTFICIKGAGGHSDVWG